jgi:hypothetical protein
MLPPQLVLRQSLLVYGFFKSSCSFAIFTAIRRDSSRVNSLAADRRPGRTTEAISAIQKSWKSSPRDGSSLYRVVGNVVSQGSVVGNVVSQGSVVVSLILVAIVHRIGLLDRPGQREAAAGSGRRLDQSCQCCTHRVIEIGIGEATMQLQPRNNPLNEDAALLKR